MPRNHCRKTTCVPKGCCVPPWSETNWMPDAQWCPIVPIRTPLKTVRAPFYTSSEDPAPQWADNIIIKPACKCSVSRSHHHHDHHKVTHEKNCWGGCGFLRTHWHDDIERHVYGTNPFSDTVNSGGSHFQ